jgi:hypothetical protein
MNHSTTTTTTSSPSSPLLLNTTMQQQQQPNTSAPISPNNNKLINLGHDLQIKRDKDSIQKLASFLILQIIKIAQGLIFKI